MKQIKYKILYCVYENFCGFCHAILFRIRIQIRICQCQCSGSDRTRINNSSTQSPPYSFSFCSSVADPNPDPSDSYVFGPPGSGFGSISQRYESGAGSGSFYKKANLDPYYFVTFFDFLFWKMMYLHKVISRKVKKNSFLLASWRSMTKIAGPKPLVKGMGPRIRIHTKMSWIRSTTF